MVADQPEQLFITLERDAQGYPPWEEERLWGFRLRENVYELSVVPTFANGLCLGDIVRSEFYRGRQYVTEVVRAGGHSAVRVILFKDEAHDVLLELVRRHGGDPQHTEIPGLFAIDVPPEADYFTLTLALRMEGEADELWDVEEATVSDQHLARGDRGAE